MLIDQLPTLASPIGTDEIPIERDTTTYKTPLSNVLNTSAASYCKMPDGTLICWGSVSNTENGYGAISFPVSFVSVPYMTATPYYSSGGGGLNCRIIVQPSVTGGNIYFRQLTSTAISTETNQQAYYIAIGRWK